MPRENPDAVLPGKARCCAKWQKSGKGAVIGGLWQIAGV
jgi:hypothetical protein